MREYKEPELRIDAVMDSWGHTIMCFNKMTHYYPQPPINQFKAPCGSPTAHDKQIQMSQPMSNIHLISTQNNLL